MTTSPPTVDTASVQPAPARPAMPAARQPTGAGRIGVVGPVLATLLVAVGVVLLHDAVAEADNTPGRSWLAAFVDDINGLTAQWWMIPAGVAVALIGVWLIVTALRPRSRKTLAVASATGVHLRTSDIARLASAAADDVDGVLSAGSVAGRRTVTVTVESDTAGIADQVHDAVAQRLAALADPVKVKIRVRSHLRHREGN
ncbi:DUF6286 domain-containing protein [Actinoplanes subtropicus]|uniref:DUF6286 domain-containing protein n=1 Tax=Actinoplanes subtropicus TaxID=543632 RepID=UPI0004C2F00B|nr:DUF6286 domain-containing protein [Actinoplanes subtropicus]